jgi:hypothetical protein
VKPSVSTSQIPLALEPTIVERFPTLREYIRHRVDVNPRLQKNIAADMGLSPGTLTKKLTAGDESEYTNRFNTEDLEGYIESTGDVEAVIEYLRIKYTKGAAEARQARALATVEALLPELTKALATMKGAKR